MPRLLYVTRQKFYPEAAGGAQRSTVEILTRLVAAGWEVEVSCRLGTPLSERYGQEFLGAARDRRVPRVMAPEDRELGWRTERRLALPLDRFTATVNRVIAGRHLSKQLDAFRPDVVLGDQGADCPLLRRALSRGIPGVYLARSVPRVGTPSILPRNLFYLANSEYTARVLEAITGEHVPIVRPMVPVDRYRVEPRDPRFITFINPIPHKGVSVALEVARRMPDSRFLFVKGMWAAFRANALDKLVEPAHAMPNVEVWEHQDDMRRVYAATRTLLVPSQFIETFGRVVLEAQINGIPVVVSRSGGLPETVGKGGVSVFPKEDVGAYVEALQSLEADPARHADLSRLARENALRPEFQPEGQFETLLEFLEERVLRGERRSASRAGG